MPADAAADGADAFAAKLSEQVADAMEVLSVYVGDRLGLYRHLDGAGPSTLAAFVVGTGMHERYAREWLEQQAVAGYLTVEGEVEERRFALPAAHAEVLVDHASLAYTAPLARLVAAAASRLPDLLRAYREGGGVGWADFGDDARNAQGDINRPWFEGPLGDALAGVPAVHDVLSRPDARLADIGCGHGWSTLALARAYPAARVDGFDVDAPSIDAARRHGRDEPRVRFELAGGESVADAGVGRYDAAFIFEALHDMPHPVDVLAAIRRALKDDGVLVVMDEAVAEEFAPDGGLVERMMYGYSLFLCLPDGMSTPGSAATGTVMRPAVLERYARQAGFGRVDVLPIEGFGAFRFSALTEEVVPSDVR